MKNVKKVTKEMRVQQMFNTSAFLKAHGEIMAGLPALQGVACKLEELLKGLEGLPVQSQNEALKRASQQMRREREAMTMAGMKCVLALNVYAQMTGKEELAVQTSLNLRDFYSKTKEEGIALSRKVAELARGYVHETVEYGLSAADVDELEGAIERFAGVASLPQAALQEQVKQTAIVNGYISQINELLRMQADKLVLTQAVKYPEFVRGYFKERNIQSREVVALVKRA